MIRGVLIPLSITLTTVLSTTPSISPCSPPAPQARGAEGLGRTRQVSCFDDTGATIKSQRERSDVLVSPDGRYRAYTEVEVSAASREAIPACTNTSLVYLAASGRPFRAIYKEAPTNDESGNGIELIDWSADGRYLLFSVARWVYESHFWDYKLILYDTRLDVFHRPDQNRIFDQYFKKKCTIELWGVGFASENQVVFRARDSGNLEYVEIDEGEAAADALRCVKQPGLWLLEWQRGRLRQLPANHLVKRHGLVEPAPKE